MTTLIYILSCVGAAFVQRVSGFGFGIFIMTVLPFLLPSYGEATTLSGLLAMVTSCVIVVRHWRHIMWRRLLPILVTFLIVSFVAVCFVSTAGDALLKRLLGGILIAASLWFLLFNEKVQLHPSLPVQLSMGTLSGVMGGLFGMQGPPAVLYFLAASADKHSYMAMAQAYFLFGNLSMTLFRAQHGFLTVRVGEMWLYGLAAVLAGTWIGSMVFRRISAPLLRRIVYLYMAVSGIAAIVSA